jgi:hypothetical protein
MGFQSLSTIGPSPHITGFRSLVILNPLYSLIAQGLRDSEKIGIGLCHIKTLKIVHADFSIALFAVAFAAAITARSCWISRRGSVATAA